MSAWNVLEQTGEWGMEEKGGTEAGMVASA